MEAMGIIAFSMGTGALTFAIISFAKTVNLETRIKELEDKINEK